MSPAAPVLFMLIGQGTPPTGSSGAGSCAENRVDLNDFALEVESFQVVSRREQVNRGRQLHGGVTQ